MRRRNRGITYPVRVSILVSDRIVSFWLDVKCRHWTRAVSAAHLIVQRWGFCVLRSGIR